MKRILAIGEALVDIFDKTEVKVGGAPLNVLGACSKLKGEAYFIGKVSKDEYGSLILNTMDYFNINKDYVVLSDASTAKALVTTLENGDRVQATISRGNRISLSVNDIFCPPER